jgi:L-seryl-tRNA(Ser) seleniumtransferase
MARRPSSEKPPRPTASGGRRPEVDPRRQLPAVDRLAAELVERDPTLSWSAAEAARAEIESARSAIAAGEPAPRGEELREAAGARARLINATGIVIHTNLGRAPLAAAALEAAARASRYSDLEFDLGSGRRGNRLSGIAEKLQLLSGAEAAFAVNNNAAALMLAVNTLAPGREVLVSRGELVEIGGSFRIPEILGAAGVRLVEVGTTNRTHPEDYTRAIGPETGLILKVHRSNFEQRGFVNEVGLSELVEIGRKASLPVLEDTGSGLLLDWRDRGWPEESFVPGRLRLGADVVCFSGDKLLGGPQAGLLLGREDAIAAMRRNPLARALRLDKLALAVLDWTLGALLDGRGEQEIPTLRRLSETPEAVRGRAESVAEALLEEFAQEAVKESGPQRGDVEVRIEACEALVGGGSLPEFRIPSWAVVLRETPFGVDKLAERLRHGDVPVVARVDQGALWLDARTVDEDEARELARCVAAALKAEGP